MNWYFIVYFLFMDALVIIFWDYNSNSNIFGHNLNFDIYILQILTILFSTLITGPKFQSINFSTNVRFHPICRIKRHNLGPNLKFGFNAFFHLFEIIWVRLFSNSLWPILHRTPPFFHRFFLPRQTCTSLNQHHHHRIFSDSILFWWFWWFCSILAVQNFVLFWLC